MSTLLSEDSTWNINSIQQISLGADYSQGTWYGKIIKTIYKKE